MDFTVLNMIFISTFYECEIQSVPLVRGHRGTLLFSKIPKNIEGKVDAYHVFLVSDVYVFT